MNKHLIWLCLILIPAILAAPLSRVYKNQHYVSADDNLDYSLKISGLNLVSSFKSTNSGPYRVQEFSPTLCDGSILLLPVYRNAEGAHILKHLIGAEASPDLQQGIIFQQQIYQELPQWQFTLNQTKLKLFQLLQIPQTDIPALVFVEKGQCNIANFLITKAAISFSN